MCGSFRILCIKGLILLPKSVIDQWLTIYLLLVGNKAKGRISKWVFQESKAHQIFQKTNISYPLVCTRTESEMVVWNVRFFGKFGVLYFLETPVLRFALLPYYRRTLICFENNPARKSAFFGWVFCQAISLHIYYWIHSSLLPPLPSPTGKTHTRLAISFLFSWNVWCWFWKLFFGYYWKMIYLKMESKIECWGPFCAWIKPCKYSLSVCVKCFAQNYWLILC